MSPLDGEQLSELPYNPEQLDISQAATAEQAVARWWGNVILDPHFDNGGTDLSNMMAQGLAHMGHERARSDIEQHVDAFVVTLEAAIKLAARRKEYNARYVGVDYHPDPMLSEAAKASGMDERRIDMFVFPWKSSTQIRDDGTVVARMGYGKGPKQIWPPEGMSPEDMAKAHTVAIEPSVQPATASPASKQGPLRRLLTNISRVFSSR